MIEIDWELSAEITNALRARRRRRMGGFSPLGLFRSSEPGVWLDPSDLSTLFQDTAGTTPVTAAGQSVALVLDKSGRGNHATQAVFASRPLYQVDSGGLHWLQFDGVDDFLITPTITPGTDKVQVFSGVRKLSDAARGIVVELGMGGAVGAFGINAPITDATANYGSAWRGSTATVFVGSDPRFAAPDSAVITGVGDISADTALLRRNGVQVGTSATDQGTGNYSAAPLYIGRRAGTTFPFNGNLYGLIARFGPNLTASQIAQTERWMAQRTGVTL